MTLRDKLREMMPKKPEPKLGTMMQFDPQPIRRHAEYFANSINYELPADRDELVALLWVFGEALCGDMEKYVDRNNKLMNEVLAMRGPGPMTLTSLKP